MPADNYPNQSQRFQQTVDLETLHKAQLGDMAAHSELYRRYSQAVFILARGICRDQQYAEDVLHNTFMQLIGKIATFQNRAPFGMWLRQIAVNESLMYLRKQKKHRSVVSIDEFSLLDTDLDSADNYAIAASNIDLVARHDNHQLLRNMLNELPEHIRLVVWLKEVEGYTHEEIAKLVDKTPSYSKTVVARAYKFLRKKLNSGQTLESVREC
jgi:RNA polymerase sigma factor (sigma-70 family)